MIDASSSFELEDFELVEAGPGTALLRIAAHAGLPQAGRPLDLVIERAGKHHRLTPLPAPPDASGMFRVAFTAPSAIVAGAQFSLELPDGSRVLLPAPRRRLSAVEQEQQRMQAQLREAEANRQAQHSELLALRDTAAEMAGQLDEAETRVDALADVVRRQTGEREAVAEQLDRAERARIQAEATIEALCAHIDRLTGRAAAAEALLARLRTSPPPGRR